jgi:hypothetical protein
MFSGTNVSLVTPFFTLFRSLANFHVRSVDSIFCGDQVVHSFCTWLVVVIFPLGLWFLLIAAFLVLPSLSLTSGPC